jgi:hypothetical protein
MKALIVQGGAFYGVNIRLVSDREAEMALQKAKLIRPTFAVGAGLTDPAGACPGFQGEDFNFRVIDVTFDSMGNLKFDWDSGLVDEGNALLDELLK